MSEKEITYSITVKDVIFDTVLCEVCFHFNTQTEEISNFRLWSCFSYTSKSKMQWIDDCSYGQCYSYTKSKEELKELYKIIIQKQWVGRRVYTSEPETTIPHEIRKQIERTFKRMMAE